MCLEFPSVDQLTERFTMQMLKFALSTPNDLSDVIEVSKQDIQSNLSSPTLMSFICFVPYFIFALSSLKLLP